MISWDSYYVIFLSAVLSLGIPAGLSVLSALFRSVGRAPKSEQEQVDANSKDPFSRDLLNRTNLGQRIHVRFFLAANAALILIAIALELIPCATTLQGDNRMNILRGLVAIVSLVGFATLGLLYAVRKGDMGWLSAFQNLSDLKKASESEEHELVSSHLPDAEKE